MGNRFDGRIAVVTGGGRGIGRAVSLLLGAEGASVVVNDLGCDVEGSGRSQEPADSVVAEIETNGGTATANYDDVSHMEGGEQAIQTALDSYGGIDVLVNSVGVRLNRPIHEMSLDDFERVIRNNVKGTFVPTKFAAIQFRRQRSGRIVNMTSDAGLGACVMSSYAAASEAVVGLTRTVARDLGKYGVTCNAISPVAPTRLFPDMPPSPVILENVAHLAVFLCTNAVPNSNGYVFGVNEGRMYLYSNPEIERSIHNWGPYTMDEMDALVPSLIGGES